MEILEPKPQLQVSNTGFPLRLVFSRDGKNFYAEQILEKQNRNGPRNFYAAVSTINTESCEVIIGSRYASTSSKGTENIIFFLVSVDSNDKTVFHFIEESAWNSKSSLNLNDFEELRTFTDMDEFAISKFLTYNSPFDFPLLFHSPRSPG